MSRSKPGRAGRQVAADLARAVALHQRGRLAEAEVVYRRVLHQAPEHPDALHFLGVLSHQRGRHAAAVSLLQHALRLIPDHPDLLNNLGNVLHEQGRLQEAAAAHRRALALDPERAEAHNNLGIVLKEQGLFEGAVAELERAIALRPQHADFHYNLGNLHKRRGDVEGALAAFTQAVALDASHVAANSNLALALFRVGRTEEAAGRLEAWLRHEPGHPVAAHLLAACSGRNAPARASDGYVEQVFDAFAGSFDEKLKRLDYRAPKLVAAAIAAEVDLLAAPIDVLDAGCGTGLCGPLLRPGARRLVGLDLSSGMLEKARERGVYDELVKDELTAFMSGNATGFDLVVSADTLVYFGTLNPAMAAAATTLRSSGWFVFTVERALEATGDDGFRLNPHGRYSHTEAHVRDALRGSGFGVRSLAGATLRMEAGKPVEGMVVVARKMPG